MPRGQLFEYAVIYHPKEKKDAAGNVLEPQKSQVITEVKRVLATTQDEVSIIAARSIPKEYEDRLTDLEIVVRPF